MVGFFLDFHSRQGTVGFQFKVGDQKLKPILKPPSVSSGCAGLGQQLKWVARRTTERHRAPLAAQHRHQDITHIPRRVLIPVPEHGATLPLRTVLALQNGMALPLHFLQKTTSPRPRR